MLRQVRVKRRIFLMRRQSSGLPTKNHPATTGPPPKTPDTSSFCKNTALYFSFPLKKGKERKLIK